MKKYFAMLTVLALAGFSSAHANLLGLGEITADGSLEVSGQSASNEANFAPANDHRGATITRLRVGLSADITEGVKGRVEATRNSNSGPGVVQYGDGSTTIAGEEGAIAIDNAYIDLADFLYMDTVRLGRQYVGRPGDLLVNYGAYNDDYLTVNPLDALAVSKKLGKINLSAVTGKVNEDDALANTDADDGAGDVNVSWLTLSSDELIPVNNAKIPLEIGYYQGTDSNAAAQIDNNTLTILDLRAGLNLMEDQVKIGLEYAMNAGQVNAATPVDYKGNAMILRASFNAKEDRGGIHAWYANASGDDPMETNPGAEDDSFRDFAALGGGAAGASDFRYGEILSNSYAAAGLDTGNLGTGLNIINIGGHYTIPAMDNKFKLMADYYMANVNEVATGADDELGTEIDLAVKYHHNDNVSAKVGYATFAPGEGFLENYANTPGSPTDDAATKLFAKLMVKWGGQEN